MNCPICEKPLPDDITAEHALFPFCSRQCKLADLNRWLTGQYAIAETLTRDKLLDEMHSDDESPPFDG